MSAVDRLAEIQARADAATDGPWHAESRNVDDPYSLTTVYNVFHNGDTADRDLVAEVAYDNADFIAHARADVPRLVAALRAVLAVDTDGIRQKYGLAVEGGAVLALSMVHAAVEAALGEVAS